jgi:hypothetical protein
MVVLPHRKQNSEELYRHLFRSVPSQASRLHQGVSPYAAF